MTKRVAKKKGLNPYIAAIECRMDRLRAPKTETFRDVASGRSETIEKGEWQGSAFEFQFYSGLLEEFRDIASRERGGVILMAVEPYVLDDEYRKFMDEHFRAIAQMMHDKKIWRAPWSVEIEGCIYKFDQKGYAKKGCATG